MNLDSEQQAFEAWWNARQLASFRKSYGPDEPYRGGWGEAFQRSASDAWQARAELAQLRELKFCEPSEIDLPTDAQIRAIFLANGFTIKEGHADLKPYVFEAAHALIDLMRGGPLALLTEQGDPANPKDDSDRSFDRPIGYLSADSLSRLNSGHDATLRSAKFGPSYLDCDVPIYLDQKISPSTIPMTDDKILEIAKSSCVASNRFGITLVLKSEITSFARAIIAQSRGQS